MTDDTIKVLQDATEAVGKTVKSADYCGRYAAVLFTDGTALVFESSSGYDGDSTVEVCGDMPNATDAMLCGLISRERHDELRERERVADNERREANDLRLYEELRRKFGA